MSALACAVCCASKASYGILGWVFESVDVLPASKTTLLGPDTPTTARTAHYYYYHY